FLAGRSDFLQRDLPRIVRRDRRLVRMPLMRRSGMLGAALAIHPAGVTVLVVLLFPDGHSMLDLVDDVAACPKCLVPMARSHAHPDCLLADLERPDPVHARGMLHPATHDRLSDDPLTLPDGERLEGLVLQPPHAPAFVVIA